MGAKMLLVVAAMVVPIIIGVLLFASPKMAGPSDHTNFGL